METQSSNSGKGFKGRAEQHEGFEGSAEEHGL